jgi:hypothetical protein
MGWLWGGGGIEGGIGGSGAVEDTAVEDAHIQLISRKIKK